MMRRFKIAGAAALAALVLTGAALATAQQWITARPNDRVRVPGSIACVVGVDGLACASHGGKMTVALVDDGDRVVAVITKNGRVVARQKAGH